MSADDLSRPPSAEELDDIRARRVAKRANRYFWYPLATVFAAFSILGLTSYLSVSGAAESTRTTISSLADDISEKAEVYSAKIDSLDVLAARLQRHEQELRTTLELQREQWSQLFALIVDQTSDAQSATRAAEAAASRAARAADSAGSEITTLRGIKESVDTTFRRIEIDVATVRNRVTAFVARADSRICRTAMIRENTRRAPFPAWHLSISVGEMNPPTEVRELAILRGDELLLGPALHEAGDSARTLDNEFVVFVQGVANPDAAVITICRLLTLGES